jgi:hypothetical protein
VCLLVDFPVEEMALQIKVVVDLAVNGDEFLKCLRPAEFDHRRDTVNLSQIVKKLGNFGSL